MLGDWSAIYIEGVENQARGDNWTAQQRDGECEEVPKFADPTVACTAVTSEVVVTACRVPVLVNKALASGDQSHGIGLRGSDTERQHAPHGDQRRTELRFHDVTPLTDHRSPYQHPATSDPRQPWRECIPWNNR